eukprot:SAG31_NODE_1584_length_7827_cov_2.129788_4_plen_364_part_00
MRLARSFLLHVTVQSTSLQHRGCCCCNRRFIYQDLRGNWHMLAHVYNLAPYNSTKLNFISGHGWSKDGLHWNLSKVEPYSFNVSYDDGTHALVATRERPKFVFDETSGEPSHLITAVSPQWPCDRCPHGGACIDCKVHPPFDQHVFTMIQPLRNSSTGASANSSSGQSQTTSNFPPRGKVWKSIHSFIYSFIYLCNFPPRGKVWKPVLGDWSAPVLTADNSTWEHNAVQEPQVIWDPRLKLLRMWCAMESSSLPIAVGGQCIQLVSHFDVAVIHRYRGGGWGSPSGIGVADSTDGGQSWKKYAGNPVWGGNRPNKDEAAGQPWIFREAQDKYWLYTTGNGNPPKVHIAVSTDGLNWCVYELRV